ncbi:hypothetical protein SAMN05421743_109105 [Thalassobacillus cyri]|uniref:Sporulation lipoprotein YhcN/YlaJ (Spore_YhcN_YlaJ) n=1 Tax=Thalassobacillus cyri TaxID=571932 RepID=A0A1H4EJY8_9BACI|nr:hypothetical protein [Thalassobacillus cyri]SEA85169.1 hypothetical protein SAMN05421743_109105 [Thalassobacillus cyri]
MKLFKLLSFMLAAGIVLAGCGTSGNDDTIEPEDTNDSGAAEEETEQESKKSSSSGGEVSTDLPSGVDVVLATVEDLNTTVGKSSEDTAKINEIGKTLEEDWDRIEKKVEENYKEDYKNIEESLYPLIDEAQADKPDTDKIKDLAKETKDKLEQFKNKLETS